MFGSPGRTRTSDQRINSPSLYQLSYRGIVGNLDTVANMRNVTRAAILIDTPCEVKPIAPVSGV